MTKLFPKSRICVIDVFPSLEKGLRTAINFASNHNVSLHSSDGRRIIVSYCIRYIETNYKNTQTPYPKVVCVSKKAISKKAGLCYFFDNYFESILNNMPIPYCGKIDLNSPDLENAAELSLTQPKSNKKYKDLISRLRIKTEDFLHPILP